jgi:hypothetical protein
LARAAAQPSIIFHVSGHQFDGFAPLQICRPAVLVVALVGQLGVDFGKDRFARMMPFQQIPEVYAKSCSRSGSYPPDPQSAGAWKCRAVLLHEVDMLGSVRLYPDP